MPASANVRATPVHALPITASGIAARGVETGSSAGAAAMPWLFNFNAKMTALPTALRRMNATYTRNSVKNVVQDGVLVQLAANQFGTSYDAVTGLYGYVPEPTATNLGTYSDGNASTYTVSNVADGTAVPMFTNGLAFGDNSVQRSATKSISVTSGAAYSISVFVIMDDGNAPVVGTANNTGDFSITLNGVIATTKLERLIGSGVYRVSASITASATASHAAGCIKYTGQSARTFRVTGIQLETGSRATSYIATTGSTATRAADVLRVPLANLPGFSSAAYTLFADVRSDVSADLGQRNAVTINDGTTNNLAMIYVLGAGAQQIALTRSGGVTQSTQGWSLMGVNRMRVALSVQLNSIKTAFNGVSGTEDTSASVPVSPTSLEIGKETYNSQFNGFIFRVGLIPQALTQEQINGLTTL